MHACFKRTCTRRTNSNAKHCRVRASLWFVFALLVVDRAQSPHAQPPFQKSCIPDLTDTRSFQAEAWCPSAIQRFVSIVNTLVQPQRSWMPHSLLCFGGELSLFVLVFERMWPERRLVTPGCMLMNIDQRIAVQVPRLNLNTVFCLGLPFRVHYRKKSVSLNFFFLLP